MKKMAVHTGWATFVAATLLFVSCQKNVSGTDSHHTGNLKIQFNTTVDADALISGKIYKNGFGEDFSVKAFKFYLHAIALANTQSNLVENLDRNNHYLVDAVDASSTFITLSVPASKYNQISFVIGVDSARNVSGAQAGVLDPGKGMFWTWSTGYIMAKLEGTSPVANTPNHSIEYHIGGFRGSESVLRKVTLNFPAGQVADIRQNLQSTVAISANINAWFNSTNPIRISQIPVTMTPGTVAAQIADNYSKMFTVAGVINE